MTGPVAERCRVTGSKTAGAYRVLAFRSPRIAEAATPGSFVELAPRERGRCVLRRPFSVGRVRSDEVEVCFDAIGAGTQALAALSSGDEVDVVGPLGRGYTVPDGLRSALLVGGGYGAAPLFFLADRMRPAGIAVHMVLGAATESRLMGVLDAPGASASHVFTTEDGSLGLRGRVTDALEEAAGRAGPDAVVYACGPMPMLAAVSEAAAGLGLQSQVAVEEFMACGIGVCWTCVVPVRDGDAVANRRSCVDGPVFAGSAVAWR